MRNSPQHSERADGRGTVPSRPHTSERHTACTSSCQSNYYKFNIRVCIDSDIITDHGIKKIIISF